MAFWRAAGYERQQHRARFVRHCDELAPDIIRAVSRGVGQDWR